MFCREQVAQLRGIVGRIRELGGSLVAVGNGTSGQAAAFVEGKKIDFPVVVDPSLDAYRQAGLRRSVTSVLAPRSLLDGARALSRGHLQGQLQGDAWQLGGAVVLDAEGRPVWSHVSRAPGDLPSPEAILAALERAVEEA
jgi:hypothetical protein